MRYIVLLEGTSPAGPPPPDLMAGISQLGEQATRSGALLDTAGLSPSAMGAKVVVTGGELSVVDGPFAESKEMISYALYEVSSKDEAIEWTNRFMRLNADLWPGWEGEARGPQGVPP
jgi:hypothetical protein